MTTPAPAPEPTEPSQGAVEAPAPEVAPTGVTDVDSSGVQPRQDTQPQPDGGQGLIASYLEGVEGSARDIVAEKLEAFRKDQDANVGSKLEDLSRFRGYLPEGAGVDYLETPVALYENLMQSPLETVQWILGEFEKQGTDLRSQLIAAAEAPTEEPDATDGADDPNRPMTRAEFEQLQQEQREQATQEAENTRRRTVAEGWFTEASKKHGLELGEGDAAYKQAILQQAAALMPQLKHLGEAAGKQAIETSMEAFVNRFGKSTPAPADPHSPGPKLATGGNAPSPQEPAELATQKDRRAFMLARLGSSS